MDWAFNQIRFTPDVEAIVLAKDTENLAEFPWSPVYVGGRFERTALQWMSRLRARRYPRAFHSAMARHRPHLLHSHFGYQGWADVPLARQYGSAHVVSFYGQD